MPQKNYSINTGSQRVRILAWLMSVSLTTLQARHEQDIMNPAQRAFELEILEHNIKTHWKTVGTVSAKHLMASYILLAKV